jgi:hypothetical protein
MHFSEGIQVKSNFKIITRERGKIVPEHCLEEHNIWVNLGRAFLPQVVSPGSSFGTHMLDTTIGYMGFGIGGNKQLTNVDTMFPVLAADYPGQETYDKNTPGTQYLERPIKVNGTPGSGGSGDWAVPISLPPSLVLVGSIYSTVEYVTVVTDLMIALGGAYPEVPISEAALMLYDQPVIGQPSSAFYAYSSPPSYINPSRPTLVAYNNFGTITKTTDIDLEFYWQLQF